MKFLHFNLIILLFVLVESRTDKRKFTSVEVDKFIEEVLPKFKNQELAKIYENTFPNTLDTTVEYDEPNNDTFLITGDINALWLRDSSFQAFPYIKFANRDEHLKKMLQSLIRRHVRSIMIDPYANAFNKNDNISPWIADYTYKRNHTTGQMDKGMNYKIWERKYELDSPISTLWFAYNYYEETQDLSFLTDDWFKALDLVIQLVKNEMRGSEEEDKNGGPEYTFQRNAREQFDTLHQGRGNPVGSCGLVKSMFRNSDDAAMFSYNIPENALLVSTFTRVASMLKKYVYSLTSKNKFLQSKRNDSSELIKLKVNSYIDQLESIASSVKENIYKQGVFKDSQTGEEYFAYEVDCFGNHYFIDDAGYPSLTSLPFFGFISVNHPLYISTRNRALSKKNPYYFQGKLGEAIGSPHTEIYYVWPLFTIMRALTTENQTEILDAVNLLVNSAKETGYMHESYNIDDASKFTRSWFAWSNSFFGYMINEINSKYPSLLLK